MRNLDAISQSLVRILQSAQFPLETAEILDIVQKELRVSRKIILKRLHDLKDSDSINARFMGPGKGVWVWWKKDSFKIKAKKIQPKNIDEKLLSIINSSDYPFETKEIANKIPELSHTQVLQRLTIIWGDGVVKGKLVGSGKGVWIWWRVDAFEE